MTAHGEEPRVTAVELEVQKSERDIRQGIAVDVRRIARRFCLDAYGWRVTRTEVLRLTVDGLAVIRCTEQTS